MSQVVKRTLKLGERISAFGRGDQAACKRRHAGQEVRLADIPADAGAELAELRARAEIMAQRLKALSDSTRLSILLRLGRGAATITDITREFRISQPAVSVHFRVLREAELVVGDRQGSRTVYRIDARRTSELIDELTRSLTPDLQAAI